jgi:acetyl-CoA carboxylase biotin carboxyl carrier protein
MSRNTEQDIEFIKALADLLHKTDLAEIEVEREYGNEDELKVRLSRFSTASVAVNPTHVVSPSTQPAHVLQTSQPVNTTAAASTPSETSSDYSQHPGMVSSPMVGTVYLAPEPSAPNFIKEGDTVSQGQTLMIVEAMKTMNQIPAPKSGVVKKVLVEDSQPIEFGMPLVVIE